jgi:Tol biopolymer transport system component
MRGRDWALPGATTVVAIALGALTASPSAASVIPVRTLLASAPSPGGVADGASRNPALSATGRVIAFDTTATNVVANDLNGAVRDVVALDLRTGQRRLVSVPASGIVPNGPSLRPAISRDGLRVVFISGASNLVADDTNGVDDVFVREGGGPIIRVSQAPDGSPANGPSSTPDISEDGRFAVFTSEASNLVTGDTNGVADVFVRDLPTGLTRRVSVSTTGVQATATSSAPAISPDGGFVSFASGASNLVPNDTNGVSDIFVRDISAGRTGRASVASGGGQQNRSLPRPFTQISDISRDGRYVVFDSDATNLVRGDSNRRTDVFLRDRTARRTKIVSLDSVGFLGNNDSFAPTITPNGRLVAFESISTNLARGGGPREDIFVRDVEQRTTSVVSATASGDPRGPELVKQLLQRPAVSQSGKVAAFISTAPNVTPGDTNGVADVFVRLMAPPRGSVIRPSRPGRRPVAYLGADDPLANDFVCQVDTRLPFVCRGGAVRLPRGLGAGRHTLTARAGGPGMLYDPRPLRIRVRVTR